MIGKIVTAAGFVLALAVLGCARPGSPAPEPEEKAPSAEAPALKAQETCPVMGGKLDRSIYVDHEGKRVYFCCDDCPKMFKADPDKYMKKMADEGVILEDTPK